MDLKFQSSFIPKQPIAPQSGSGAPHTNLFSLISSIIFIISVGLVGAVLIADYVLNKSLESLDAQIVEAENSFELSTIGDLQREDIRIESVKKLLSSHLIFSKFLELLSQSTFQKVSYNSLNYEKVDGGVVLMKMSGLADDFNSLVLQASLFRSIPGVNNVVFSDFKIGDKGGVGFTVDFALALDSVLYKNYLGSVTPTSQ